MYPEPPLPAMGPAGSKIVDPTFGTTILRVTDGNDGPYGRVMYATNPSFNSNNTRLVGNVLSGLTKAKFWVFDASTFTVRGGTVPSNLPNFESYSLEWSGRDPDVIYGAGGGAKLWSYNVALNTNALIKDFTSVVPVGYQTGQLSKSFDDDVFSMNINDLTGEGVGFIVYKRSTNAILVNTLDASMDETKLDKTGRYLTVISDTCTDRVFDLSTTPATLVAALSGTTQFCHNDTGHGTLASDYTGSSMGFRSLATPTSVTQSLTGYFGFATQSHHVSMNADNEGWVLVCRHNTAGQTVQKTFDNEMFLLATDGSGQVRRIAHHRSNATDYYATPFANISRDGRFVAFSSNWGGAAGIIEWTSMS